MIRYAGIDIGKKKCQACMMEKDGTIAEEFVFSNDSDGISLLLSRLDDKCKAVMESTGNYWIRVYNALEEHDIEVKLANPLMTKAVSCPSIKKDLGIKMTLFYIYSECHALRCYVRLDRLLQSAEDHLERCFEVNGTLQT